MKLWILRPVSGNDSHWSPWYDKCFGFVVRAESETEARETAASEAGDENWSDSSFRTDDTEKRCNPWLDPRYSTCNELTADGDYGLIMRDFSAA